MTDGLVGLAAAVVAAAPVKAVVQQCSAVHERPERTRDGTIEMHAPHRLTPHRAACLRDDPATHPAQPEHCSRAQSMLRVRVPICVRAACTRAMCMRAVCLKRASDDGVSIDANPHSTALADTNSAQSPEAVQTRFAMGALNCHGLGGAQRGISREEEANSVTAWRRRAADRSSRAAQSAG